MPRVTSRHNPRLKEAAALVASSRDRRKAGRCVLEGEHLIGVYLERIGAPETLIVEAVFCEVSTLPAAIGVMAVVATPRMTPPAPGRFHLLLDDLQDPGNVGTMLRTAAAAGVDQVLLSKHCAFAWSPKVLRAWAHAFRPQGRVGATVAHEGVDLYRTRLSLPLAIAIGNEGAGLSPALLGASDLRLTIPMPGGAESLNAASAAAVVLFESVRQQRC